MSKNTLLSELINYISANSSGNVVIAAPTSGYALDVTGTGRFTGNTTFSANVGIGTSSPVRLLDVRGAVNLSTTAASVTSTSGAYADLHLRTWSGASSSPARITVLDNWIDYFATYTDGHRFRNWSSDGVARDLMTITGSGNVGIGPYTPEGPLHVNGIIDGGYIGILVANRSNTIGTSSGIDFCSDNSTGYNGNGNGQIVVTNNGGVAGGQKSEMNLKIWNGSSLITGIKISDAGKVSFPAATAQSYALSNSSAVTISSNSSGTIASCSLTTTGKPVFINVTGDINPLGGPSYAYIYIYRDGSPIGKYIIAESLASSANIPFALTTMDIPNAGAHTYTAFAQVSGANAIQFGETGAGQAPTILAIELL